MTATTESRTSDAAKGCATILACLLVIFLVSLPIAHPLRKTNADVVAISYGAGPFEGHKFQRIVGPASGLTFNGWFDDWYEYPTTLRNYIASKDPNEGDRAQADFIPCGDKDKVEEQVQLLASFKLNTTNRVLRKFHETIGLKYHAWNGGEYQGQNGWDAMLNDNVRNPLENAVNKACRKFTTDQIRSGEGVLDQIAQAITSSLKDDVNATLGADFFCGPGFQRGRPACPNFQVIVKSIVPTDASIVASYAAQKSSANGIVTAQNNAKAKKEQAQGDKEASDAVALALTPQYLELKRIEAMKACAENPKCTLVVKDGDTGVNVNVGK